MIPSRLCLDVLTVLFRKRVSNGSSREPVSNPPDSLLKPKTATVPYLQLR